MLVSSCVTTIGMTGFEPATPFTPFAGLSAQTVATEGDSDPLTGDGRRIQGVATT